jgi:hypothetical protein
MEIGSLEERERREFKLIQVELLSPPRRTGQTYYSDKQTFLVEYWTVFWDFWLHISGRRCLGDIGSKTLTTLHPSNIYRGKLTTWAIFPDFAYLKVLGRLLRVILFHKPIYKVPWHHKNAHVKIQRHSYPVALTTDRKITACLPNWYLNCQKWWQGILCCLSTTVGLPCSLLRAYYSSHWGAPPYEAWRRYDHKVVRYEAGNQNLTCYLELGHLTTSEKTTPFTQFLPVSHEVKFETKVKDKLLTIYPLSIHPGPLHKLISTNLRCPSSGFFSNMRAMILFVKLSLST